MVLYNYSSLQRREAKIYNIGGYNISGGLSIEFLKVVAPVALVIVLIGFLLSLVLGISFFDPFDENFSAKYTLTFIVLGIAVGMGLWKIQFAGYRLYQYLGAYFKPKKVYSGDFKNTEYVLHNYKIKTFIKNIL